MPHTVKGMLLGGLLPALLFGVTGLLQKAYGRLASGTGPYLVAVGAGVALVGAVFTLLGPDRTWHWKPGLVGAAIGVSWSLGMALVLLGIVRFGTPLSQLAPLYNMNTLVVAVLALVFYAEAREVAVLPLLAGAAFIVVGGVLVVRA